MSFKFKLLPLPCLKLGNLRIHHYTLSSFVRHHALRAWCCNKKRQSLLFSTHLFGKGAPQIKVHCHPPRTTPRFARRFAAPNDSPFYSTRFLRLGGHAPTRRDEALSSSAFHSALRASLHSSEWQSPLFYALFEIGRARSEYQWLQSLQENENLGAPNRAQKSSFPGDLSP